MSRGKQPGSPAKAPKWPLSDKGGRGAETTRKYYPELCHSFVLKNLSRLKEEGVHKLSLTSTPKRYETILNIPEQNLNKNKNCV